MSASLQASARAAYRDLWRASRFTFSGDPPILTAFREKMRTDAAAWKAAPDADSANANFQAARDVAAFLRRNVVQMRKTAQVDAEGNEVYHVGMNKYSELGDNDANRYAKKEVPDMAEVRRQRRAAKSACQAAAEAAKAQA
ncbi:unnamed protein product [Peniophora sp. CBMAI 1063]|nr:unnamed protein product [Peniophora sp. CBMAI 1063]